MKKLNKLFNNKFIMHLLGIGIGGAAIYFSIKNVNSESLSNSLKSINTFWIIPIVLCNFVVIIFKSIRWQAMLKPVKHIKMSLMYKVLLIGFMANNILPARLGEAVRIHMLGKNAAVSLSTTTATMIADRIIEGASLLIITAVLVVFTDVPKWMYTSLLIVFLITFTIYTAAIFYSTCKIKNKFMKKFQEGVKALTHFKLTSIAFAASFASWFLQGFMIYMTQLAFDVHLPIWGIIIVMISINLAIALPSAPSNLGTFEFACILAYSYLGLDSNMGLLIGATYHILQLIPVTLAGGLLILKSYISHPGSLLVRDPDTPC